MWTLGGNSRLFSALLMLWGRLRKVEGGRKKLSEGGMNERRVTLSLFTLPYLSHRPRGSGK
jgi:hypothetical protein